MSKRKLEQSTEPVAKKKSCTQFKDETSSSLQCVRMA